MAVEGGEHSPLEEETEEVLPDGSIRTRRVVVRQHCHSHGTVDDEGQGSQQQSTACRLP